MTKEKQFPTGTKPMDSLIPLNLGNEKNSSDSYLKRQ